MIVRTKNVPENVISKKELIEAAKFFGARLLSKRLIDTVSVVVEFKKLKDCKGYCDWVDKPVRPKQFRIVINNEYKKRTALITLGHELVHLKQYATGELSDETIRSRAKWKNKIIDETKIDYWDMPFEIEAYGREFGLYHHYMTHVKTKA